jgi:CMP-N,N'-diacetyllegionaminic acid synthase
MNILGVILARKGSKGIPKKNHLKLNGKNLVEIAVRSAKKSKLLTKIILSTDDSKLKKDGIKSGALAPFARPKKLSHDKASSIDALKHSVLWLRENEKWNADIVVLLPPTTPFKTGKLIDDVIKLLLKSKANAAMTITDSPYPLEWTVSSDSRSYLKSVIKNGHKIKSRQQAFKTYIPAGMVYAIKTDFLFKIKGVLPQGKTKGFYVHPSNATNIDTYKDYLYAKINAKKLLKKN